MRTIASNLFRAVVPGMPFILLTGGVVLDLLIGERLEGNFGSLLLARAEADSTIAVSLEVDACAAPSLDVSNVASTTRAS